MTSIATAGVGAHALDAYETGGSSPPVMSAFDPGFWGASAAGIKAAGATQESDGIWRPPVAWAAMPVGLVDLGSGEEGDVADDLSPNGDAALAYAGRGWHVFPVQAATGDPQAPDGSPEHLAYKNSKAPHWRASRRVTVGSPKDGKERALKGKDAATTDAATIRRWWSQAPDARIGCNLEPSGLVAVDLDDYKPEEKQRLGLLALPAGLPETLTSLSPSGGTHRLYKAPCNARSVNFRDGEVLWNRYIVLPSPGSGYRWDDPEAPIADLPEDVAAGLFDRAAARAGGWDGELPDDEELAQRTAELEWWLHTAGLGPYRMKHPGGGQVVAELERCPFDPADHSAPYKAVLYRASGGGWGAKCVVGGCGGESGGSRWPEIRKLAPLPTFSDLAERLGWERVTECWCVEVPRAELGLDGEGAVLVMAEFADALGALLAEVPRTLGPRWVRGGSVKAEPVRWLWQNRVAVGRLNALAGDGGDGKTFASLALAVAACGGPKPPGFAHDIEPGTVIYLSAEDSAAVLVERAIRMGIPDPDDLIVLNPEEGAITLKDIEELEAAVVALGNVRLIVLDPLLSFLGGGADIYRDNEVRSVMDPLRLLAEQHDVPVLYLIHVTKSDRSAADRVTGSVAFKNLPRSVLMTGDLPSGGKAIVRAKGNLGVEPPAIEYAIEDRDGLGTDTGMLVWGRERPDVRAADLTFGSVAAGRGEPAAESGLGRAVAFLRKHMTLGEAYLQKDLEELADQASITARTLKTAKQRLGIESERRDGNPGPWSWVRHEPWEVVA